MQKILLKRVLRNIRSNLIRYIALAAIIILGMYIVVSLVGAAETIIAGVEENSEENNVEDGQFSLYKPLTKEQEDELTYDGVDIEEMFYLDYLQSDESTLRVFANREVIDLIEISEGKLAEAENQVVLEKRYCEEHNLSVGDSISIGGTEFEIVGIGTVPDYDAVYKEMTDTSVNSQIFGIAFVTEFEYESLESDNEAIKSEEYLYAYKLNDSMTDDEFKEKLLENTSQLLTYKMAEDNGRIGASADDMIANKVSGMIAGVIVMILLTYVISVFVVHEIEQESSVIGAMYALGVKRKDLMKHYIMLPVCVTFLASIIGMLFGISKWGIITQMKETYEYYSIPDFQLYIPGYLILYSLAMPVIITVIVNFLVIYKKLSVPALKLIHKEQKSNKFSNINLGKIGFVNRFRIRQMLKEVRTSVTVICAMFVALMILMLGLDSYVLCKHISTEYKEDTHFEYMYTLKYPEEMIREDGETAFIKSFTKEEKSYKIDISLLGIDEASEYFDTDVEEGKDQVVISSAVSQKFNLSVGDMLVLFDEDYDIYYAFKITDVTQYSPGMYVFMSIESMRELFGVGDDYYNVIFSNKELDIASDLLYAQTTNEEISSSSDIFVELMTPMIAMLISVSVVIFAVILYLMIKVMLDRSEYSIALLKIFGYRNNEVRKLYLNGNFYMVAIGALFCIPAAKLVIDAVFPFLVANVACSINLLFSWQLYLLIYVGIIIMYLIINQLQVIKIRKMIPAEILKDKE